jgi:hypothetical protein
MYYFAAIQFSLMLDCPVIFFPPAAMQVELISMIGLELTAESKWCRFQPNGQRWNTV